MANTRRKPTSMLFATKPPGSPSARGESRPYAPMPTKQSGPGRSPSGPVKGGPGRKPTGNSSAAPMTSPTPPSKSSSAPATAPTPKAAQTPRATNVINTEGASRTVAGAVSRKKMYTNTQFAKTMSGSNDR